MKLKDALRGSSLGDIIDASAKITKLAEFESNDANAITMTFEANRIVHALNGINNLRQKEEEQL